MFNKMGSNLIKKVLAGGALVGNLFYGNLSFSQELIDFKMKFDTIQVKRYEYKKPSILEQQIHLQMSYADYKIYNPKEIKKIMGRQVYKIELIYTNYPKEVNFETLNKKRLVSLYQLYPELFRGYLIDWKAVVQTDCNEKNVYDRFHGFIITYRSSTTPSTLSWEKQYLKELLDGKVKLQDSVIFKVMKRNKWENMAVVTDFTGSMSPYIGELLLWHKLNLDVNKKLIKNFVFFNDGDMNGSNEKVIGKTGGIYSTSRTELDSVVNTALITISNGYGGESEENDIEALISAQQKNPKSNLILIADNWSNMRDIELIKQIKTPVKVILCGALEAVNIEYLFLADITKGSVHTIEKDIINLHSIKVGETILINGREYKKIKEEGKYELVR